MKWDTLTCGYLTCPDNLLQRIALIVLCGYWLTTAAAQQLWVNELHYDNTGADVNELVEIAVWHDYKNELAEIQIELYNGSNGSWYATHELSTFTEGVSQNGFTFYSKQIGDLQDGNGAIALIYKGFVIHFLSYGSSFVAANGTAQGLSTQDIGVFENDNTAAGLSLQLTGSGTALSDFIWSNSTTATPGAINAGQRFGAADLNMTLSDVTAATPAKPGDTIAYTLTINNTGEGDALDLQLNRVGDPNTAFLQGSFKSTPLALSQQIFDVLEETATSLNLKGLDPDGDGLTFTILNGADQGTLSAPNPVSANSATLTYTPSPHYFGADQFTFQVEDDDGNQHAAVVRIQVQPVNDPPFFSPGEHQEILEDAGFQRINPWATGISTGADNEAAQQLIFKVLENSNPNLFVQLPQIEADGTLLYEVAPDTIGSAFVILQLMDNGGTNYNGIDTSARDTLFFKINPVNDAPVFIKGNDILIPTTTEMQTFTNWATGILPGPPNELAQTLQFIVVENTNPGLFAQGPQITPDGTLTFTPSAAAVGTASLTIQLMDDGGTDNGGRDHSDFQIFTISLQTNDE